MIKSKLLKKEIRLVLKIKVTVDNVFTF